MCDQVYGLKLEDIPAVIKRPMTQEDIVVFRDALQRSYNPKQDPNGIQKKDFKVEKDNDYLYFQIKTGKVDEKKKEPIFRLVYKMRKWKPEDEKK